MAGRSTGQHMLPQQALKTNGNSAPPQNKKSKPLVPSSPEAARRRMTTPVVNTPPDTGAIPKEKNNIVIPEFSAWLTSVLERCHAENIRNLPRKRAPTPSFPKRRPREACSMPISGRHDLSLAIFNFPSRVFRHGCRRAGKFRNGDRGGGDGRLLGGALELKKSSSFRTSFRASGMKISGISAARRACLPIGENAKRRFAGHSATARMKQFPAVVFRHGCRRAGCLE